jgi:hypothetical protein
MWKLGLRPQYSFSGNIYLKFSAFCLCSVVNRHFLPIRCICLCAEVKNNFFFSDGKYNETILKLAIIYMYIVQHCTITMRFNRNQKGAVGWFILVPCTAKLGPLGSEYIAPARE